jgi:hypothetical protein
VSTTAPVAMLVFVELVGAGERDVCAALAGRSLVTGCRTAVVGEAVDALCNQVDDARPETD